jgi:acyl dehydratase
MDLAFFEDIAIGEAPVFGAYEVTEEEIIHFAKQFDPQSFHLDKEAAKKTLLGGLSASGWHTASMAMRLLYDSFLVRIASMGSPGVDELKWIKPVRPGDRLSLRRNVLDKKESKSRPDFGVIQSQVDVLNQAGDLVMSYRSPLLLRRRGAAVQIGRPHARQATQPNEPAPEASEPSFQGRFFDDIVIGQGMDIGSVTLDKDAIFAFAHKYDPQPFHTDEAAAAKSQFGGLIASGWHTAACFMGELVRLRIKTSEALRAQGVKVPELGPSPGFNNMRWRAPVYAGDRLQFKSKISNKRAVSRPGWGLVFIHNTGFNQHDQLVFEFEAVAFWQMRP